MSSTPLRSADSSGTLSDPGFQIPSPEGAIIITFSSLKSGSCFRKDGRGYIAMISRIPKHAMKYPDLLAKMVASLESYGSIPNDG
jgi:hypothetical protein